MEEDDQMNSSGIRVAFRMDVTMRGKDLPSSYDSYMYFSDEAGDLLKTKEDVMDAIYMAYREEMNRIEPRWLRIEHSNFTNTLVIKELIESITIHSIADEENPFVEGP